MHSPKRKSVPAGGKHRGRKPLDDKTFTCTVYLDIKTAQWLQRRAHTERRSRAGIMRELLQAEMNREAALERAYTDERMDMMAGSA